MPVHNASSFLREAVESILVQTLTDFEFLIIDDGSTDESAEIIRSYQDERIKLITNPANLGITPSLNKGIELARSDLIARMDADDISYPDRLEKQYKYMAAHSGCAMVSSWVRTIDEDKNIVRQEQCNGWSIYYNLTFECCIYHPSILYRREAVINAGGYSIPFSEDYDLFWKLCRRYRVSNLDEILMDYRISPQSLHMVTHRDEYRHAHDLNVKRNICYYLQRDIPVPASFLECYRYNVLPLINNGNTEEMIACILLLDEIKNSILTIQNPNRNIENINAMHNFKRRHILQSLVRTLPYKQSLKLLKGTGAMALLPSMIRQNFSSRVQRHNHGFAVK